MSRRPLLAIVVLALYLPTLWAQPRSVTSSGAAVRGLQIGVAAWPSDGGDGSVAFEISSDKTFVDAPADAQAVLERARARMGGSRRLNSVSTLRIEGVRTLRSGEQFPFVDRLLFPDRYRTDGTVTHSIDGPVFWQQPRSADDSVRTNALRNVKRRFTEESLLYLLRAPGIMPLRARIQSRTASTVTLTFEGPDQFQRSMVFDSGTGLPLELFHSGTLTQAGVSATVERRLSIESRSEQNGIQVPTKFRETIGTVVAQITVAQVVVDGSVTLRDFRVGR